MLSFENGSISVSNIFWKKSLFERKKRKIEATVRIDFSELYKTFYDFAGNFHQKILTFLEFIKRAKEEEKKMNVAAMEERKR